MKKDKHHITAWLFSLLLVLPLLLIIFLQLWQVQVQHEAKERLEKEQLQTVSVLEKELVWVKPGEVTIQGEMFDVKSMRHEQGRIILTGIFDRKETAIRDFLSRESGRSGFNISVIQLLVLLQCLALIGNFISGLQFPLRVKKYFSFLNAFYHFIFSRVIVPPPKSGL